MLASWGRALLVRSVASNALRPQLRVAAAAGQFQPITQVRTVAVATGRKSSPSKSTAAKKTSTTTTKATAAKKDAASTKKTAAAKTAAAKKTSTATKKATKSTTSTAKKSTTKKAASPRAAKKLTPEEKKKNNEKERILQLKAKALDPPGLAVIGNKWASFVKLKLAGTKGMSVGKALAEHGEEWRQEYHNLPAAEVEAFQRERSKDMEKNEVALREWVLQHTPAQIHEANLARARLRKMKAQKPRPRGIGSFNAKEIPDDRFPKHPRSALIWYIKERLQAYSGEGGKEKMKAVQSFGSGFKDLSEAEKKKFQELAAQDQVRYRQEMNKIGMELSAPKSAEA